jgi:hypothetical protein
MTDKISQARQRLRDLARKELCVYTPSTPEADAAVTISSFGEVAGPLFVALQGALRVAEELRAESRQQPVIRNDDKDLAAKAEAADRIEATIFLALG